jgi:hypothetical protein
LYADLPEAGPGMKPEAGPVTKPEAAPSAVAPQAVVRGKVSSRIFRQR